MKLLNRVGGSLGMLYLVCILFAVGSSGFAPVVLIPHAHANSSATASSSTPADAVKAEVKAEPVEEEGVIDEVASAIPNWVEVMTALFLLAGAITAVTPTPKDNAVLIVVRKFFDILALNVGGAKNAAAERNKNKLS